MAEQTQEQMLAEMAELKKQLAAESKRADKAEKAAAAGNGDQVKTLKAQLKATTEALKVAEATKPKNAKPTVEVEGAHFEVVSGERRNGKVTTRDELAKDLERCAELVRMGSGLLRKVNI